MEVHHVKPLALHTDQNPYDLDGLVSLCRPCHFDKLRVGGELGRAEWLAYIAVLTA